MEALMQQAKLSQDKDPSETKPKTNFKKTAFMVNNSDKTRDENLGKVHQNQIKLEVDSAARAGHFFYDARLFPDGVDRTRASSVKVANNKSAISVGQGDARFEILDSSGEWIEITLRGALLMSERTCSRPA